VLKLSDNPPITHPEGVALADLPGTWWVAHTKPRQEKAFAHELRQRGTSYFLPLVEKLTIIRGRKLKPLLPLFPGYVFACGTEDERLMSFRGNRLARTIPVVDQARLVRELTQIERALGADVPVDPWPYLKVGRWVTVRSGPLKGIEGIVSERKSVTRLVLRVATLGQAVAVEIDAGLLEPLG
jgi:transcription antitermination factor NusG